MKNTNEIQVTDPQVVPWRLHRIMQQKYTVQNGLHILSKGKKFRFSVNDKDGKKLCITTRQSMANMVSKMPEMLQYVDMLRTMLANNSGGHGTLYKQVDDFLNQIG